MTRFSQVRLSIFRQWTNLLKALFLIQNVHKEWCFLLTSSAMLHHNLKAICSNSPNPSHKSIKFPTPASISQSRQVMPGGCWCFYLINDQYIIHFHYQYAPKWWNDCPLSVKYYLLSVLQIGHLYSSMTSRHVHVRHIASAYHIIIVCFLLQVLTDFERLQRPLHGYFNSFKRI